MDPGFRRKDEQAAQPSFHRNLEPTDSAKQGRSTNGILIMTVIAEWIPAFAGKTEEAAHSSFQRRLESRMPAFRPLFWVWSLVDRQVRVGSGLRRKDEGRWACLFLGTAVSLCEGGLKTRAYGWFWWRFTSCCLPQ